MYRQIILAMGAVAGLCGCNVEKDEVDDSVAIENSICLNYPKLSEFLPKAEKGNIDAMRTARHYYEVCGGKDINVAKAMHWTKKIADLGEFQYIVYMSDYSYLQIDPINEERDKSLFFDPLLYWVWQKKMCAHKEAKKETYDFREACEPLHFPTWYTPAQWQKIITSPPTVKDKSWYQYLPKGCEQGECLPK